jgi:O-acetyl-ADP-ribose deacetylase (regulator of RNase III)
MGKGIALEFKKRFSSVNALKEQQKKVGEVATLHLTSKQLSIFANAAHISPPEGGFQERYIFYMITKQKYFHKPTLEDFTKSLIELKTEAQKYAISAISMPRIGCGLDKLEWSIVKKLISETFSGTNIVINVYSL